VQVVGGGVEWLGRGGKLGGLGAEGWGEGRRESGGMGVVGEGGTGGVWVFGVKKRGSRRRGLMSQGSEVEGSGRSYR